ncbi:flagellar motor switch protein FliM [Nitrosophilus kaiyonis]|uniref:flagellar motor switch protein FliM n=1 Tax=Nitrosophilus kaiyonis TaxID=2930200 RepID=UPI00249186BA|nr:flagellar motor switch protein FliM [Nitrosophilus kaiyonis]
MSEQDFLSQDEIDALLGGNEEESIEEKSDIVPFDFSEIESIKKGGLPGLEIIYERWVKLFRDEVRKIIPKINMVSKESIYVSRFNSFMSKIPMPSSYTTISMKPLKENALFVVDSRLVFTIISVLFGGPAKPFKVEGREFTKLEVQIIGDFIDIALKTFEDVWKNFYPINLEKKSIELNPSLARVTSGNEKVVVVECNVEVDGYEAPIFFCFPQGMFMPIKDIIYTEFIGEENSEWQKKLKESLVSLNIKITLELGKEKFLLKDILEWKVGDDLILNIDKDSDLMLVVENTPKYKCKLGKVKERYAALIKEPILKEENE